MCEDPYNRILKAVESGSSVTLEPEEVRVMALDLHIQEWAAAIKTDKTLWADLLNAGNQER